jgi:hypothetical protein
MDVFKCKESTTNVFQIYSKRVSYHEVKEAHTPQNGIEAIPACIPANDMKFLTCTRIEEENICNIQIKIQRKTKSTQRKIIDRQ